MPYISLSLGGRLRSGTQMLHSELYGELSHARLLFSCIMMQLSVFTYPPFCLVVVTPLGTFHFVLWILVRLVRLSVCWFVCKPASPLSLQNIERIRVVHNNRVTRRSPVQRHSRNGPWTHECCFEVVYVDSKLAVSRPALFT